MNVTATQTRIAELKAYFASYDYDQYGNPIGVDNIEEWVSLREELESL